MGTSIPLVALNVKPVEQPDILGNYQRLAQLKALQQNTQYAAQEEPSRQQIMQNEAATGAVDLQTKQIALKDQQAMNASMQQWDGKSIDDLAPLVIKNGGSANAVMGLKAKSLEMRQQAAKIAADDATTGAKNVETMTKKNDVVVGALTAMQNVPDDQLPQTLISKANELAQQGILDPQHVQMVQQLAQGNPQAIRPQLANMAKGMMSFSQALDQAKQQESARHNTAVEAQTAATSANTQAYRQGQLNLGAQRVGVENARLKFQQAQVAPGTATTGDDFLGTLPAGMQAQVKATANGDIAIPPPGTRNPQAQALRTAVLTYDPTYTDARYKGKQNFKTSGDAQNIVQLSTAMEHADRAIQNSATAGYAPMLGNKTLESSDSAAYMQDAEFLTGEVGKLVKNGVLSVDEGNKISSGLTSARQTVRDSALNETMDLLGGKTRAIFQKYKTSTGQDLPVNEFFDTKSQQRLTKYGIVGGPAQSASPAAASFKVTATGPNGHKIGSNDGGATWLDVQTGQKVQ